MGRFGGAAATRISLVAILWVGASTNALGAGGDWVGFQDDTAARMIAEPEVGLADTEEKDFAVGDVDQDGDDDLVVVRKTPGSIPGPSRNVLFINEDGVLVDRTADYVPGFFDLTNDRDVVLADVTGDGWLDIITATMHGDPPRVYLNLGSREGTWLGFEYQAGRIPEWPDPNFCAVAAGDIDHVNGNDLYFVECNGTLEDKLLINDGSGFFTDETTIRLTPTMYESDFGTAAAIADLNGDGWEELIKSEDGPVEVIYNDGTGAFDILVTVYTGSAYFFDIVDLDHDDRPDLYVVDDGTDRYLINQGNGDVGTAEFISYLAAGTTNGFGSNTAVVDLNKDGFDDVVVGDVDLDRIFCTDVVRILRNTGVSGPGNLIDTNPLESSAIVGVHDIAVIDLDGNGWPDLIFGTCSGYTILLNVPPVGIAFSYPQGLPTLAPPGETLSFHIQADDTGIGELEPESGLFFLSVDGSPFESSLMTWLGDDLYEATLPASDCLTKYDFYVSAELTDGLTFTDPPDAPESSHGVIVGLGTEIQLREEFENDVSGWTVVSVDLDAGEWEQAAPIGTIFNGAFAAPNEDATNGDGTMAFVTQNGEPDGEPAASDIDGGPTHLISPIIDLAGTDATIDYARWFFTNDQGTEGEDFLTVAISNDGGDSWVLVPEHATSGTDHAWETVSLVVSDYVAPTAEVRIRFSAQDQPNNSITEAGIDNFQVSVVVCDAEEPCEGDANGDGSVDPLDSGYVLARFGCPVGTGDPSCDAADQNGDGAVDPLDGGFVLARFGSCD